jgi:hypothetical protein
MLAMDLYKQVGSAAASIIDHPDGLCGLATVGGQPAPREPRPPPTSHPNAMDTLEVPWPPSSSGADSRQQGNVDTKEPVVRERGGNKNEHRGVLSTTSRRGIVGAGLWTAGAEQGRPPTGLKLGEQ